MSYHVSSRTFDDPYIPELIKQLAACFGEWDIPFYVVGAIARDIVLGMIFKGRPARRTNDLDIAIMVRDWVAFERVSAELSAHWDLRKCMKQKQRWYYKDRAILDIIPFGEIAKSDRHIYWPPDEIQAMSVSGFTVMAQNSLSVILDEEVTLAVASLPGLFVLKLAAWQDRHWRTNKDAEDIMGLLDQYLDINMARAAMEHTDIFERHGFTAFTAGAILIARDIRTLLADDPPLRDEICRMLRAEITKKG